MPYNWESLENYQFANIVKEDKVISRVWYKISQLVYLQ